MAPLEVDDRLEIDSTIDLEVDDADDPTSPEPADPEADSVLRQMRILRRASQQTRRLVQVDYFTFLPLSFAYRAKWKKKIQ